MHLLFLYIDQIYKISFLYTNQSSHIPEARKRNSCRADFSRIAHYIECTQGEKGGGGGGGGVLEYGLTIQLFYVENTLTQSLVFSSKAGCSKSISSITFAIE